MKVKWVGHVARLGDKKTVKRIMVGKLKTVDNVEDLENSMV
jgi:hypothetical protein